MYYTIYETTNKINGKKKPVKTCPHCSKTIDSANYARYHGDKCKAQTVE